jgi:GT2 family glycosyltransferase
MNAPLDIVIVNFNTGDQLRKCVSSLSTAIRSIPNMGRVIIVDNNSKDDSAERLGNNVVLVRNAANEGFGRACNRGAALGNAEFVLFLNPDTTVGEGILLRIVEFMKAETCNRIGIVGVGLRGDDGLIARSCARFPTRTSLICRSLGLDILLPSLFPPHFLVEWDHVGRRSVDQVMGAFFFVRRVLFNTLGGFDERFFVYFEDLDFSLRALNLGYQSYFIGDLSIYHRGGGSSSSVKGKRLFYSLRSRILYCEKHFGSRFLPFLVGAIGTSELMLRVVRALSKLSMQELVATAEGYLLLFRWVKSELPRVLRL